MECKIYPVKEWGTWCLEYVSAGKRVRKRFKTKEKAEAEARTIREAARSEADLWAKLSTDEKMDLVKLHAEAAQSGATLRRVFEFWQKQQGRSTLTATLDKSFQDFMSEKKALHLSHRTVAALDSNIGRFIEGRESMDIGGITRQEVTSWIQQWTSPRTYNSYLTSLKTFFTWAVRAELLSKNPAATLMKVRERNMPDLDTPPAISATESNQIAGSTDTIQPIK